MNIVTITQKSELEELLFKEPIPAWYYNQRGFDELVKKLDKEVPQKSVTCHKIKATLLNGWYGLSGDCEYVDDMYILAFSGPDKDLVRGTRRYLHEIIITVLRWVLMKSRGVAEKQFLETVIKWPVRLVYSQDFLSTVKDEERQLYKDAFFFEGVITSIKLAEDYDKFLLFETNFAQAHFDCIFTKDQKSYALNNVSGKVLDLVMPPDLDYAEVIEEYREKQRGGLSK